MAGRGGIILDVTRLRPEAALGLLALCASCVPAAGNTGKTAQTLAAPRPVTAADNVPSPQDLFWQRAAQLLAPVSATPADPFDSSAMQDIDRTRSLNCLTAAVYYEARSEPEEGQRAVAQVVLNRVRHPAFPNTVCGVVFQGSERSTGCQFSFTCDGSMDRLREPGAWARSRAIAQQALDGYVFAPVGNATHYHTLAVHPYWAKYLAKSAIVGTQIFYRWAGTAGQASAFRQRYGGLEPVQSLWDTASADRATVHAGLPSWIEEVQVGDGEGSVTIHRGADIPLETAEADGVHVHRGSSAQPAPDEPSDTPADDDGGSSFGVHVHSGSTPARS